MGDVLGDSMVLKALHHADGAGLSYFVCDVCDAFFAVPLNPDEQGYFAGRYRGHICIWSRVTQGSLDGSTLYGRLAALIG